MPAGPPATKSYTFSAGTTAVAAEVNTNFDELFAVVAGIAAANRMIYAGTTGVITTVAAATNGQILIGSTGLAPALAAITAGTNIGVTNGAGTITIAFSGTLPIASGGTNSTTALNNSRIMVSSGGAIVEAGAMTNGQLLIGSTGAAQVVAAITAGANITVTNAAGSITIAGTASGDATREGRDAGPDTTTSTTANQTLSTVTTSIPVTSGWMFVALVSKTTGSADTAYTGLQVNGTNVHPSNSGFGWANPFSTTNQNESAFIWGMFGGQTANNLRGGALFMTNGTTNTATTGTLTANLPNAEITAVTVVGHVGNAAVTVRCEELLVFELVGL